MLVLLSVYLSYKLSGFLGITTDEITFDQLV